MIDAVLTNLFFFEKDKSCAIIKNYTEKVWKKSEALQNFLSKMNIDGMEEMCPYFAKVVYFE